MKRGDIMMDVRRKVYIALGIIAVLILAFYKLDTFWYGDSIILGYGLLITGMIVCVIYIWITVSMNRRQNTKK